jgi:hypothetical protein
VCRFFLKEHGVLSNRSLSYGRGQAASVQRTLIAEHGRRFDPTQ